MNLNSETNDSKSRSGRFILLVGILTLCFYAFAYMVPLNERPLIIPDETRYAEISREMLDSDSWLQLRQAGLRYYEKPPMGYWLNAMSIHAFGKSNLAVRLPSTLAAGLTALTVFLLVLRIRREKRLATLSALIYLSSVLVFGVGTFAVLDSMFALFVTLSMVIFYTADEKTGRNRLAWLALSGASCGMAFLTKGFTALVIPAVTVFAWAIWEKKYAKLLHGWIVPVVTAGLFVLPFAYIIHRHNPDFWNYFFWTEHVQRFLDPLSGQHRQPAWYYIPIFLAVAMPWTFFLPSVILNTKSKVASDKLTRYCLCWFFMPFLFFSVCGGKLPTYILPCFVPFSILAADAFWNYNGNALMKKCALAGAILFGGCIITFFCWLPFTKNSHFRESIHGDPKTIAMVAAVLMAASGFLIVSRRFAAGRDRVTTALLIVLSFCGMYAASFFFLPRAIVERKSPDRLLRSVASEGIPEDAYLISTRSALTAACWNFQKADIAFYGSRGELTYGLTSPEVKDRFLGPVDAAIEVMKSKLSQRRPVVLIADQKEWKKLKDEMPRTQLYKKRESSWYICAQYLPEGDSRLLTNAADMKPVDGKIAHQ